MSEFLDELARSLAKPMPRSRALRVFGMAIASAAVPLLRPAAGGARSGSVFRPSCHNATCPVRADSPFTKLCKCNERPTGSPSEPTMCQWTCCLPDWDCDCQPDGAHCRGVLKVCGPDITGALDDALARVKSAFGSWSGPERYAVCTGLVTLPAAKFSWDIRELGPGGRKEFAKRYQPDCGTCGFSVQIGSDCHYSGSVNYVAYGVMMRLCHDYLSKEDSLIADWFSAEEMQEMIYIHKNLNLELEEAANLAASTQWALAGYHSGSVRPTPPGDRKQCQRCSKPYSGRGLTVNWLPKVIGPTR